MPLHRLFTVALVLAAVAHVAYAAESNRNPVIEDNLADPVGKWIHPAVTAYGEGRFSLRSGPWRYIRYRVDYSPAA
jgi:hypothetical protein